jgi:hypothetical protein
MKPHLRVNIILFRPTVRDRVEWMAHWITSRSSLLRRRLADPMPLYFTANGAGGDPPQA